VGGGCRGWGPAKGGGTHPVKGGARGSDGMKVGRLLKRPEHFQSKLRRGSSGREKPPTSHSPYTRNIGVLRGVHSHLQSQFQPQYVYLHQVSGWGVGGLGWGQEVLIRVTSFPWGGWTSTKMSIHKKKKGWTYIPPSVYVEGGLQ